MRWLLAATIHRSLFTDHIPSLARQFEATVALRKRLLRRPSCGLIAQNPTIMKPTIFRSLMALACGIGLSSYVIAGPGSASGPGAQLAPVDDNYTAAAAAAKSANTSAVPGGNAQVSAGGSGSAASGGQSESSSGTGQTSGSQNSSGDQNSQSGRATGSNPFSSGAPRETTISNFGSRVGRGEKMVIVPDQASDKAAPVEKSEVTKKFEPSLLDAGLPPSTKANANAGQPPVTTAPQGHPGWEKGKHNPHQVATPGVSPIPSASPAAKPTPPPPPGQPL